MKRLTKPVTHFFKWLRNHWKLSLFLVVIIALIGFFLFRRSQGKVTLQQTANPQREHIAQTLDVSGVVDAKEKASLRFAAGGKVTYLGAKEGDTVKRNQTLARIDGRTLQKQLQQDLNLYFNQRMNFEQNLDNVQDQAPTNAIDRNNQIEQKTLENSVLDVEIQTLAIQNTVLSSPIQGVLVSTPASVTGVNLLATDTFEVINPQTLVFRAVVDQADIAKVQKGQKVEVQLDAYPDQKLTTTINYVAYRSSQSSTGTVYIIEMPIPMSDQFNQLEHYRLGMNGDANIILAEKENVLTIPLSATKEKDGKTLVTVKTGEKTTEEKEIQTGLENDDKIEVTSGLSEMDRVVIP